MVPKEQKKAEEEMGTALIKSYPIPLNAPVEEVSSAPRMSVL